MVYALYSQFKNSSHYEIVMNGKKEQKGRKDSIV